MSARAQIIAFSTLLALPFTIARADIFRWDNGKVIPGTEGITPGPGVRLVEMTLDLAQLNGLNLSGADFSRSNLAYANFANSDLSRSTFGELPSGASLVGANLSNANLTDAGLWAGLWMADLSGAVVIGAPLLGLSREQLYSTASYQERNLQRIVLFPKDLTAWNFADQDLRNSNLGGSILIDTNLSGADLRGANLSVSVLLNADLSRANIAGASFNSVTTLTSEQLYSTASYQAKSLRGIGLQLADLAGWNLYSQDLSNANLSDSNLANTNLSESTLMNANLENARLAGADLQGAILTHADLTSANLTKAIFSGATLANATLTRADARGTNGLNLAGAYTANLIRPDGRINGLNLAAGERLVAHPGVPIPATVNGEYSIDATAEFNLTDNAMILEYAGTSPIATVRQQLTSGRGGQGLGGKWNGGAGITSSTASIANVADADSRSIGYAENAAMPLGPLTTFRGEPVDDTSILIAYTRTGDANLDGVVNDDDVTIIGATYAPGVPNASWALGDFDYNGFVDDDDVTLLGAFYDPSAPPIGTPAPEATSSVAAVPEPSTAALVLLASIGIARLYRKRLGTWRAGRTELPAAIRPPD
jgi:uncharacterized protein YjbI with pentapeptide repeats